MGGSTSRVILLRWAIQYYPKACGRALDCSPNVRKLREKKRSILCSREDDRWNGHVPMFQYLPTLVHHQGIGIPDELVALSSELIESF